MHISSCRGGSQAGRTCSSKSWTSSHLRHVIARNAGLPQGALPRSDSASDSRSTPAGTAEC